MLLEKAFVFWPKWWYNEQHYDASKLPSCCYGRLSKIACLKVDYVIINFSQENFLTVYYHDYEHDLGALKNRQSLGQ